MSTASTKKQEIVEKLHLPFDQTSLPQRNLQDVYWVQIGGDIDGEAANDHSGESVAVSADGSVLAIGAQYNDGNGRSSGHVRVFKRNSSEQWIQIGSDIDGEAAYDQSGISLALSANGTIIAIGAIYNDGNGSNSGHVRVFKSNATEHWNQMGDDIDGEAANDNSRSVALSSDGTIVAIGASYNDGSGTNSGHVRVYKINATQHWIQIGKDIDGEAGGDAFGYSLALSDNGTVLAIGSYYNDGNGSNSGHVRVFKCNETEYWNQIGDDIDGEATGDYSGWSVALSGNGTVLAIGARYNDGNGVNSGHVRVFKCNETEYWNQIGNDIDGEAANDHSGISVALSSDGTILVVGAPTNDDSCGTNRGHVRVFKSNATEHWTQIGGDIDGDATNDHSGHSVALSADGTTLVIGAPYNDGNGSNSGHVKVYSIASEIEYWNQVGDNIEGEAVNDQSGQSVALSADGTIVAIGAPYNDGSGTNSGHVRVYKINATQHWIQIGKDIDGEAGGDTFGYSLALSDNGTVLAIGAFLNDGNGGSNSGHVRVFKCNETEHWNQIGDDIDGEEPSDQSGKSVALSGDGSVLAIGAFYNGNRNGSFKGHVRIFKNNATEQWNQIGDDIVGEGTQDYSGISVDLSSDGTVVAIGAHYNNGNGGNSGHVRVFKCNETTEYWNQIGDDIDGERANDLSGEFLALSADGTVVAISARYNDDNARDSGHVRVFKSNETEHWNQIGTDIDGEAAYDNSGISVALSANGTTLAIGADRHHGSCGSNSGHVRVFQSTESEHWNQIGSDIDGEVGNDRSGRSVALSADGATLAVGANYNDGNGYNSGHVKVYSFIGIAPTAAPAPAPAPTPGAKGDPHFTMWSGVKFDFHGVCDLVLLKIPHFKGIGMDINIRTKKTRRWSYISAGAIRIGDDSLEVRGGDGTNLYWINKLQGDEIKEDELILPTTLEGFPIQFTRLSNAVRQFVIDLGSTEKIIVKTWHSMVSININSGTKHNFEGSLGLMGSFDNGQKIGRNNQKAFDNLNEFGLEWQVQEDEPMLFHNLEGPQAPAKCEIPSSLDMRRRLGELQVSKLDAENACKDVHKEDFDICVFDVIATMNWNVASSY